MRYILIFLSVFVVVAHNFVMPVRAQNRVIFDKFDGCQFKRDVCVWEIGPNRVGNIISKFYQHPIPAHMRRKLKNLDTDALVYLEALKRLEKAARKGDLAEGLKVAKSEAWPAPAESNFAFAEACLRFNYNYVGYGEDDMKLNVFSTGVRCAIATKNNRSYTEFYLSFVEVFPFGEKVSPDFIANSHRLFQSLRVYLR